jgi:hypothetical protein
MQFKRELLSNIKSTEPKGSRLWKGSSICNNDQTNHLSSLSKGIKTEPNYDENRASIDYRLN